jgi:hypothetical protein
LYSPITPLITAVSSLKATLPRRISTSVKVVNGEKLSSSLGSPISFGATWSFQGAHGSSWFVNDLEQDAVAIYPNHLEPDNDDYRGEQREISINSGRSSMRFGATARGSFGVFSFRMLDNTIQRPSCVINNRLYSTEEPSLAFSPKATWSALPIPVSSARTSARDHIHIGTGGAPHESAFEAETDDPIGYLSNWLKFFAQLGKRFAVTTTLTWRCFMTTDELVAEGIVTLDFAMRFLSVSRPTLNKLIERGDLPTVVLVDKRRSIPKRALLDFAARKVQTASE